MTKRSRVSCWAYHTIVVPKALPKSEYPKIEEYVQFLPSHQGKNE